MSKVTREQILTATTYFYGSTLMSYASLLEVHLGVRLGEELPPEVVGEQEFNPENTIFTEDGETEIEVEEFELFLAVRVVDGDGEITYFAFDYIEEE